MKNAKTVLLVEDTSTQAIMMMHLLKSSGDFVPTLAKDGDSAIQLLSSQKFDVVCSDINMPGKSGYDLCRWIKSQQEMSRTLVVLLTSFMHPLELMEIVQCGADSFMYKLLKKSYFAPRLLDICLTLESATRGEPIEQEVYYAGTNRSIEIRPEQAISMLLSCFNTSVFQQRALTPDDIDAISKVS